MVTQRSKGVQHPFPRYLEQRSEVELKQAIQILLSWQCRVVLRFGLPLRAFQFACVEAYDSESSDVAGALCLGVL